jgi:hypothetical protein
MGNSRYVFHSRWTVPGAPAAVFAVLADVENYPAWWPQVRSATPVAAGDGVTAGELTCRSLLPYDLVFTARQQVSDADSLVLRAAFTGDLDGFGQWSLAADGPITEVVFDQDVEVGKPLVRRLGRLARPLLRANHELMMRGGEAGLRRHLAARSNPGG